MPRPASLVHIKTYLAKGCDGGDEVVGELGEHRLDGLGLRVAVDDGQVGALGDARHVRARPRARRRVELVARARARVQRVPCARARDATVYYS